MNTTPSIPDENDLRKDSLRARDLECLAALRTNTTSFRQTVHRLIELGVRRAELVAWAVDAGYSESHIRNLLTRLLSEQGTRIRRLGAGHRTPEALAILATARNDYGDHANQVFESRRSSSAGGSIRTALTQSNPPYTVTV